MSEKFWVTRNRRMGIEQLSYPAGFDEWLDGIPTGRISLIMPDGEMIIGMIDEIDTILAVPQEANEGITVFQMMRERYLESEFPILEYNKLSDGSFHFLVAKRTDGVRYSAGCFKLSDGEEWAAIRQEEAAIRERYHAKEAAKYAARIRYSGLRRNLREEDWLRRYIAIFQAGGELNDVQLRRLIQYYGIMIRMCEISGERYYLAHEDASNQHQRLLKMADDRGWTQSLISMFGEMVEGVFERIA